MSPSQGGRLGVWGPAFSSQLPRAFPCPCSPGLRGDPRTPASSCPGISLLVQTSKLRHCAQVAGTGGFLDGSSSEGSKHQGLWGNELGCGCPKVGGR